MPPGDKPPAPLVSIVDVKWEASFWVKLVFKLGLFAIYFVGYHLVTLTDKK